MTLLIPLNSSLGTLSFGVNSEGSAYYKIGGADTEYPFSSGKIVVLSTTTTPQNTWKTLITATKDYETLYISGAPLGYYTMRKNYVTYNPDECLTQNFTAGYSTIWACYNIKANDVIQVMCSGVGTHSLTAFIIE